jgi:DNA invertase Pin-like site-specific DNA recombinase
MSSIFLVAYARVSGEEERPENQKYAIFRRVAEMEREFIRECTRRSRSG